MTSWKLSALDTWHKIGLVGSVTAAVVGYGMYASGSLNFVPVIGPPISQGLRAVAGESGTSALGAVIGVFGAAGIVNEAGYQILSP